MKVQVLLVDLNIISVFIVIFFSNFDSFFVMHLTLLVTFFKTVEIFFKNEELHIKI